MIQQKSKKAFTLVELLIVIAGIGALMAVLVVMNSGGTAGARSAKCKSHMRNLAQAVQSFAISHEYYPNAGSYQSFGSGTVGGKYVVTYHEAKGWIGWNESCMNNQNNTRSGAYYAVTNGSLWAEVRDLESYVCPEHRKLCRKNGVDPLWSYVMNAYFGYDWTRASKSANDYAYRIQYGKMGQAADRTLLFAEIPFVDVGAGEVYVSRRSAGDQFTDCTLQFRTDKNARDSGGKKKCNTWTWDGPSEVIGFNHKVGRDRVAHIVFADSHVEELALPANVNENSLKNLTANLCNGIQLTYVRGRYVDPDGNEN